MPQARDEAGNIWETDAAGNPVRLVQPAGQKPAGNVFTLPPDPIKQAAEARANEDQAIQRQRLEMDRANQNKAPAGYRFNAQGGLEYIPGGPADPQTLAAAVKPSLTAKERADAIAGYQSATQLERIVAQLEEQYKVGPGATSGIGAIRDYMPTTANQQFDRTGNAARGIVGSAMGFTGGQLNTATEAEAAVGPYLPQSSDRDATILDKIARLKALAGDARTRSTAILGGVPDQNGRITPQAPPGASDAMRELYVMPGAGPKAAAPGTTSQQVPIPPAMQQEYDAWINQNAGNMDAGAYVQFRKGLDAKYGFGSAPDEELRGWAEQVRDKSTRGGTINTRIPGPTEDMSSVDRLRNNVVNNPAGAFVAQGANMGGFGIPEALTGGAMDALSEANPVSSSLGQIAGSVAGTGALSKLGGGIAGRLAPKLLGGGKLAQAGRNLATDAAYSGIYGQTTEGDALPSAGAGAVGSIAGQVVGKGLGRMVGGIDLDPVVQALRARNIPVTVGQALGGPAKSIEDAMTSAPGLGDIIGGRRLEGLQAFNREALNEAGSPIGATVNEIGQAGVDGLMDQIGNSYDNATAGVRVPLDPKFGVDMSRVTQARAGLPDDYGKALDDIGEKRIQPTIAGGELTGEGYQQTMRGLKSARRSADSVGKSGFEHEYRGALSSAMDALTGQMKRGGGQKVVEGLAKSDESYRLAKAIQQAIGSAKNGAGSGEVQVFTPAQLNQAGYAAAKKYPGPRPFADLADAGQKVLPSKIPDSGTGKRIATMALPGVLGGTGAGVGYASGDTQGGAATGLAAGALLALGGTRGGQKLIIDALTGRPDALKRLGRKIGKRSGVFGAATVPLGLETVK